MRFFYKLQPFENMRLRIRRVNINRKIRRLGKHLNHLQLLYIRIQQLKASFCCAKTSLLRGTTAIRGGADTFVFLSHEILGKFRALLFQKKGNRTRQIKQERRTSEAVRPFEPRRGSTLVEWPHLFCGEYQYKRLVRFPCALFLLQIFHAVEGDGGDDDKAFKHEL